MTITTNFHHFSVKLALAVYFVSLSPTFVTADISGDNIVGKAIRTNGAEHVIDDNANIGPATEFMELASHGLFCQMDVDSEPFNRVKITIHNPGGPPKPVDEIQWRVEDLDCTDIAGGVEPVEVTMLLPLPGNTLDITSALPFVGDGFRIFNSAGQMVHVDMPLCATFAIITAKDLPGDVNGDGMVNLLDIQPFINTLNAGMYTVGADVNRDGKVNLLDVQPLVDAVGGG